MSEVIEVFRRTTDLLEALKPWQLQPRPVQEACIELTLALVTLSGDWAAGMLREPTQP